MVNLRRGDGLGRDYRAAIPACIGGAGISAASARWRWTLMRLVDFRRQLGTASLINGAAAAGATTMRARSASSSARLEKDGTFLSEALGQNLLGPIQSIGSAMGYVLDKVTAFVNYAPGFAKWAVIGAAVGSAILVIGGGLWWQPARCSPRTRSSRRCNGSNGRARRRLLFSRRRCDVRMGGDNQPCRACRRRDRGGGYSRV